jgi:fluoride exporter
MPAVDRRQLAAVFLGGAVGGLLRTGLVEVAGPDPGTWPWVTFGVNIAGTLLLGAIAAALDSRPAASAYWRPLLGVGFCGALTTFSTLQLELVNMLDVHAYGLAAGYLAASVGGGFAAVALGRAIVPRPKVIS